MQLLRAGGRGIPTERGGGTPRRRHRQRAAGILWPDRWRSSMLFGRDVVFQRGRRTRGKSTVDEDINFAAQKNAIA